MYALSTLEVNLIPEPSTAVGELLKGRAILNYECVRPLQVSTSLHQLPHTIIENETLKFKPNTHSSPH